MITWRRSRAESDDGSTLLELLVGMGIMSIFLSIFAASISLMTTSANKTQGTNDSSTQTNLGFLWLDKNIRYASAISPPGKSTGTGDWYVEWRSTYTGTEQCTQVRVDIASQQLQRRTWDKTVADPTKVKFVQVASSITNGAAASGSGTEPFIAVTPTASENYQQLTVNLSSDAGPANSRTSTSSTFTFTAINSSLPPPATAVCQEAGRP